MTAARQKGHVLMFPHRDDELCAGPVAAIASVSLSCGRSTAAICWAGGRDAVDLKEQPRKARVLAAISDDR
jgi:hypothetical protein